MVQCALNGGYVRTDHPAVPVTVDELVADVLACRDAGAGSVHFHPRAADGSQTLSAEVHNLTVAAVRAAVPGLELSCSTQQDIEVGGHADHAAAIRAWTTPPDLVSLNLEEPAALELGAVLLERGIGIEAGVFTLADADRLLTAPWASSVHRVLVEVIYERDPAAAVALATAIDDRVAPLGKPTLWHGDAGASWAVVDAGLARGRDVRVGLEDALIGRDGGPAPDNATQVAETLAAARARTVPR
ncbi:MAG: 3-keto-5-aminohexanoate cleavage protein [Solirubrobacteraceae bacterium]|nr:3-keto-5-aminohexanoate cleavage protein [Patulibacter sp.]